MAKLIFLHFVLMLSSYTLLQTIYGQHQNKTSFSLRMIPFNSPEFPSYNPNRTRAEIMNELIRISNDRGKALERYFTILNSSRIQSNQQPVRPVLEGIASRGLFLVEVGIGTFKNEPHYHKTSLMLELGSDVTWTQCQGCSPCFYQRGPFFPWSHSRTYKLEPCSQCPNGICRGDHCYYDQDYGAYGHVRGYLARETFTFSTEGGFPIQIEDMAFVCAFDTQSYEGEICQHNDIESGVFSLSRQGYTNFMRAVVAGRQLADNGQFSYCLPPLDSPILHPLLIRFSTDIPSPPGKRTTMHIVTILQSPEGSPFYYLELIDLSVDEKRLILDPQVFAIGPNGSGGCIIDTSFPFSQLTRPAYDKLVQILAKQFEKKNKKLIRKVDPSPFPGFSLCYLKLDYRPVEQVKIEYNFGGGAYLQIDDPMDLLHIGNDRYYCLRILPAPPNSFSVIGAMHQVNYRFVYDIRINVLVFYYTQCGTSN